MASPIYIATNSVRVFFLYTLSSIYYFNDGHSDWCEMISHCSFDLHFSNSNIEHLFICLLDRSSLSLKKSFGHFYTYRYFQSPYFSNTVSIIFVAKFLLPLFFLLILTCNTMNPYMLGVFKGVLLMVLKYYICEYF